MKILYFHQHFQIPTQAGGTRSYEMARALIAAGHQVTMVCGEAAKLDLPQTKRKYIYRGDVDGIDVIQIALPYSNNDGIAKRMMTFLKFAAAGVKIALHENYDLVFATTTPLTAGIPGIAAKVFRRKKFIFEVRDLWPELPKALGMKNPFLLAGMSILEWMSYHAADKVIGLSPGICEGIRRRSQKNKPIVMIPNGCDLQIFTPANKGKLNLAGISESDTVAIFTGAHGIANGLDAVLNAATVLLKKGRNDIKIAFIGSGNQKDRLQERAKNENLTNCLFFDPVPKIELNRIVASADIGLMILKNVPAFYYGTSPNKFFDYIASGLPVLNNYPGFLADHITKSNCGLVVPPDDPEAFANALIKMADSLEMRKEFGINARKLAEQSFSRKKLSADFVDFLTK
jgi:glycosyltransferase involved in cell wall biosynthesis